MKRIFLLASFLCAAVTSGAVSFDDLTPQERLGQTLVVSVDVDSIGNVRQAVEEGKVGGVLIQWGNYSQQETRKLIEKLQGWAQKSPHQIPLLVSIDYEGGTVYTPITLGFEYFPTNMMLSAAADEEEAAALGYLAGQELRRSGVHVNFSPVLDVNSNPNNPIIGVRSFGSDVGNVTKMGLALMDGFQAAGVGSVVKHFPGHGDTSLDSHVAVPVVKADKTEMEKVHLKPFQEAIAHGVDGVMTGHVSYPALDDKNIATFSKPIVQNLLRQKMGFTGLVVTDSLDMKGALTYCSLAECAVRSLAAGGDLILLGRYVKPIKVFDQISQSIETQQLQPRVDEAARRVFALKERLGLLSPQENTVPVSLQAYQTQLAKISDKAVTLVRNQAGTIPLVKRFPKDKKPVVCAVFFAPSRFADQLAGFSKPFLEKGWTVRTYNAAMTPKQKDRDRALRCAQGADVLVIGSLQWADKTNTSQKNIINELFAKYPKATLLSTMSPYDIDQYTQAYTVLALYGLNRYTLQTAARVLLGDLQAQGVLPVKLATLSSDEQPRTHTPPARQKSQ